jgi:hypothetical protein
MTAVFSKTKKSSSSIGCTDNTAEKEICQKLIDINFMELS